MRMLQHHDEEEKADSEGKQTAAPAVNGAAAAAGEGRRRWTTGNQIEQAGPVIPTMGKWLRVRGGGDGAEDRIEHEREKNCACDGKVQHERGKDCARGQAPWRAISADG